MKKTLSLLLILAMLFSILPTNGAAAETRDTITDSDYDGIPDTLDAAPNSNNFTGTYKSGNFTANLSYTMDYSQFFGDNTVYNQSIADFSTWAAQLTYENDDSKTTYAPSGGLVGADGVTLSTAYHIDALMRAHGMENVIDYRLENGYFDEDISLGAYADDDITEVYFGHHRVTYAGEAIEVIAIFVRGTNSTEKEWCSNFDVGDLNRFDDEYDCVAGKSPRQLNHDWMRKSNHRGFDVCSNRIRRALNTYMETYLEEDVTPVYWLSGHSRGGAISNIISSYLVDEGEKVFAYTFASPNTTANTEASAAKYDCIFNLVNGDDFVPMLPMPEWGFTRYGRTNTIYASSASSNQRSTYLGNTSYSYSSDLQTLVNKFVVMTKNNAGVVEGWRDVYVYHCHGGTDVDHDEVHLHDGEVIGEFRSGTRKDFGTDSNWNGYNEHTKKYSYCVKDKDGGFLGLGNKYSCCQTPAYAMQILAITMGNLGLSAGWDFLTSYKLADYYDFGKTSLITSYATKIIDPHYMENYYLIQKLSEEQGNVDDQYTHSTSLYTDETGRPEHVHTYTFYYYEGQEPTCTQEGSGYKVCNCSQINADWYDDVVQNVKVPALGHDYESVVTAPTCTAAGCTTYTCTRCGDTYTADEAAALGHDYQAVVTAPTCTEAGYTTYTCSRCGDSYTADEVAALGHLAGEAVEENRVEPTTTTEGGYDTVVYCQRCGAELSREHTVLPMITVEYFVNNSISLAGDIGVNFYVNLNEVSKDNAKVVFTWGSDKYAKTKEATFSGLTANKDGNYKLSVQVYAKQMTEVIHAELYDGTEKIAEKDYSVADYCRTVLNMPIKELADAYYDGNEAKAEKLVNLCKAMLIYGGMAQKQFKYRTDDRADKDLEYTLEDVGALGTTTFPEGFAEACGIEFKMSSLMLESETSYRMYFSVKDQTKLDNLTVKLGDETLTYTKNGSYIYYSISNIPAKMILSDYTLTFGDQTVTANAGEYIAKALDKGSDDLKETVKALYWYSTAAIEYFAS